MKRPRLFVAFIVSSIITVVVAKHLPRAAQPRIAAPQSPIAPFLVAPYLQLGDSPQLMNPERLSLLWQAEGTGSGNEWKVEYQRELEGTWIAAEPVVSRPVDIDVSGLFPHTIYRTILNNLVRGETFTYRVVYQGQIVFSASGRARKPPGVPQRIVAFGDAGADTQNQIEIALQVAKSEPDLVVMTGDLVYMSGTIRDYRRTFFPIYNTEKTTREQGAPLLRSVLFAAVPGNHDLMPRDLDFQPDAQAYFYFWDQPLNGPSGGQGIPKVTGSSRHLNSFRKAAGTAYPRMANFSFDAGDVHFTSLDMNAYTDWSEKSWREWLKDDLEAAKAKPWRIVLTHQPPFSSAHTHEQEQRARLVVDLLEAGNVNLVLSGHVHNYQRTRPIKFRATGEMDAIGQVPGTFEIDTDFDGVTRCRPEGVIYVVTGAGGSRLYNMEQDADADPKSWQPFTFKLVSKEHSFTILDVTPGAVEVRQVTEFGREIDRFRIEK